MLKIESEHDPSLIPVILTWQSQTWYPVLPRFAIKEPILLPCLLILQVNLLGEPYHLPQNQALQLVAWIITVNLCLRKEFQKGFRAYLLRRNGTISNYSSSWNKWDSWCDKQKVDLFQCAIKWIITDIMDYNRVINVGQCVATNLLYHYFIMIKKGKLWKSTHTSFIAGIFQLRPPQPRYTFIWEVQ